MNSERKQKLDNHRKKIRREELDNYFQERRSEILQIAHEEEVKEISLQLQTSIQKESFLEEAARDLCGEPKPEWLPIIRQLRKVITLFNGQFHQWRSKSIISNLCLAYKQEYKEVGLADEITHLYIDMVYLSLEYGSKFVPDLMEYEIVPDVLALASDKKKSIQGRILYLMFLSKLASSTVRDGAGYVVVEIGRQLAQLVQINQKTILKYLEIIYNFCLFKNSSNFNQIMNLTSTIVPIISHFMSADELSWRVHQFCIYVINSFLKSEKNTLITNIFFMNGFVVKALTFFQHPQPSIRIKISATFCYFSNQKQVSKDLLDKGILDFIYTAYEKFETSKNSNFTNNLLLTLSNLAQTQYAAEVISSHPAFGITLEEIASQSNNMETAYYCLNSIVLQLRYLKIQELLKKYDFLKFIVQMLIDPIFHHKIYTEILDILINLANKSLDVFHLEQNIMIAKLQGLYNISIIVQNLCNNIKNKYISQKADILINIIQRNIHTQYQNNLNSL